MEFGTFPFPRAELWQPPGGTRLFGDQGDGVVRADNHWDVLTAKDGVFLFLPESFPVQRNADGAPLMSDGNSGTRA